MATKSTAIFRRCARRDAFLARTGAGDVGEAQRQPAIASARGPLVAAFVDELHALWAVAGSALVSVNAGAHIQWRDH